MARSDTTNAQPTSVTRTIRAAVRLGEDFLTLEETTTLPIDASDEQIAAAVETGWRIYRAQRAAIEEQVAGIRAGQVPLPITVRDPDAPASEKQRHYLATLQDNLGWTSEQLAAHAAEQGIDLVSLTKGQASSFIDGLKKLADGRHAAPEPAPAPTQATHRPRPAVASQGGTPATERQIVALSRLAQGRGLNLDEETERRFGVVAADLSDEQARALIAEWQAPARDSAPARSEREPAPAPERRMPSRAPRASAPVVAGEGDTKPPF